MIHATITGLEKDEPADEGCRADLSRTEVSAGQCGAGRVLKYADAKRDIIRSEEE